MLVFTANLLGFRCPRKYPTELPFVGYSILIVNLRGFKRPPEVSHTASFFGILLLATAAKVQGQRNTEEQRHSQNKGSSFRCTYTRVYIYIYIYIERDSKTDRSIESYI